MCEEQKFRGVHPHKDGGFVAYIGHEGKRVYLGWFREFDNARTARLEAEGRLFGQVFDRREPEIDGAVVRIPLHGQRGKLHGWTLIDVADFDLVTPIAWTIDPRGYVVGRPAGFAQAVTLHRFLMLGGAKGGKVVDHANRDRLDNRRCNLRLCESAENTRNTTLAVNNSSGAKGVSRTATNRWRARIWKDRNEIHLGTFDTIEEASAAYDIAAEQMHGEFASPNRYSLTPGVTLKIWEVQS